VRRRPVEWRAGAAALVARQPQCTVVPIALEYTFWDERLPEALALIGKPIVVESDGHVHTDQWQARLTHAMTEAQDELACLGIAHDPALFITLLRGGSGVAFVYDTWRRMQAGWRGAVYRADHGTGPQATGKSHRSEPTP
jgi:hypothetical protein